MIFIKPSRKRAAVTEIVGAVLTVAITLIAGAAVFGYVRGQAGVSEQQIAKGVGTTVNFLQERFVVVDLGFGSSTQATAWLYDNGNTDLQLVRLRLYDSAGLVNLLYNYTVSGSSKTDYVYDLGSSLSTKCKTAAASYESPTLSSVIAKITTVQSIAFTIPPTTTGCPSFGQTFQSGTTYTVSVLGLYGNTVTYFQKK